MNPLSKNNSTLLFILLTGVLIVTAFISYNKILQYNSSVEMLMQTNSIKNGIVEVLSNLKDSEIKQRGFLITGDSTFLKSFAASEQQCNREFTKLSLLVIDPRQKVNLNKLKTLVDERYKVLQNNFEILDKHPLSSKEFALYLGKIKMDEIRRHVSLMLETEDKIIAERKLHRDRTASFTPILLLALSLVPIAAITFFFFRLQKETSERILITESNRLLQEAKEQIEISEKRFRTLSETIPHMTWTAKPNGIKNFFNKYFLDYTGFTFEELENEGWRKTIFPDDLDRELAEWQHTLETGEEFQIEKRVRHHSGEYRWHLARAVAQRNSEGAIVGWIGTSTEIEEQKRFTEELEAKVIERTQELKTKNIELENANTELASFNYIASHDLQEPLRKIQGFSKRIINEEENLSDTSKDYFKRINAAAHRMQNLITSILSYSRTNNAEKVFEETNLNQVLNEVKGVLQESIQEKNALIESYKLPTIHAIPIQMHQLFLNLISNSLKYSKQDVAPLIKISAEKVTGNEIAGLVNENGSFWKIEVSDNGIGFEQQYENKIFEVFQRLHGKKEYEGTGIGLSICKKIVHVHHGTISALGNPGVGSTFTFYLPVNDKF